MVMRTKIKEVYMNGKLIRQVSIFAFALTLLLALSLASASGGGAQGGSGGGSAGEAGGGSAQSGVSVQTGGGFQDGGSGDQSGGTGDMLRTRDRTGERLRTRDRELDRELLFKDSEGRVHQWQERFNNRLQKYEAKEDPEGLARALHRVANRYRLSSDEDAEGFVDWALKYRPWAIEE
jgi:hypothetical protein